MPALGKTGIEVSPIVFGAMDRRGLSGEQREELVRKAIDLGLTTIDTAPLYEFGDSERWVGRAVKGRRDQVLIATKVGLRWADDARGDELFGFPKPDGRWCSVKKDSRPSAVRADVEESLRRLGVDVLDLVQVHHPDRQTPIEDTMGALLELRAEGKLRAIGVSNFSLYESERAVRALGAVPLACLQLPYSLLDRRIDKDRLPWARSREVGVLAYSPLAEGILAGRYMRRRIDPLAEGPFDHPKNAFPANRLVTEVLAPIASQHRVSVATVALAALRATPGLTAPIVGVSGSEQLEDAARAATLDLDPSSRDEIRTAFGRFHFDSRAGGRRRDRVLRKLSQWGAKLGLSWAVPR